MMLHFMRSADQQWKYLWLHRIYWNVQVVLLWHWCLQLSHGFMFGVAFRFTPRWSSDAGYGR